MNRYAARSYGFDSSLDVPPGRGSRHAPGVKIALVRAIAPNRCRASLFTGAKPNGYKTGCNTPGVPANIPTLEFQAAQWPAQTPWQPGMM